MGFKPMRMRWSFVLQMVAREIGRAPDAKDLARFADANKDLFPSGMSDLEAEWIVEHPDAFTDVDHEDLKR